MLLLCLEHYKWDTGCKPRTCSILELGVKTLAAATDNIYNSFFTQFGNGEIAVATMLVLEH